MKEQFDFAIVDRIAEAHDCKQSGIIAILQEIQEHYHYLPREVFPRLAEKLEMSEAEIYSIATFYENFSLEPKGKYVIKICDGTACHIKGSPMIQEWVKNELNVNVGETTADGLFSLESVACLGCCSLAPVMSINGRVYGKLDRKSTAKILKEYSAK